MLLTFPPDVALAEPHRVIWNVALPEHLCHNVQLADGLDFGKAVDDIKEVIEWLRSGGTQKIGITGFCQGGALTCLAAENASVDCAVAFYGYPKSSPSKVSSLTAYDISTQPSNALWKFSLNGSDK